MLVVPVWLNGLLHRTCKNPQQIDKVKEIWDELADDFLNIPFVRKQDTLNPLDNVDYLELALKFSKGLTLQTISRLLGLIGKNINSNNCICI